MDTFTQTTIQNQQALSNSQFTNEELAYILAFVVGFVFLLLAGYKAAMRSSNKGDK